MKVYDKIYSINTYLSAKSGTFIPMWVIAKTIEEARGKVFARYPSCTITTVYPIFKDVLSIDDRSFSVSVFEVNIKTSPNINIPSIYVLADYFEEVVNMCKKQYSAISSVDIIPIDGMVLADYVKRSV